MRRRRRRMSERHEVPRPNIPLYKPPPRRARLRRAAPCHVSKYVYTGRRRPCRHRHLPVGFRRRLLHAPRPRIRGARARRTERIPRLLRAPRAIMIAHVGLLYRRRHPTVGVGMAGRGDFMYGTTRTSNQGSPSRKASWRPAGDKISACASD